MEVLIFTAKAVKTKKLREGDRPFGVVGMGKTNIEDNYRSQCIFIYTYINIYRPRRLQYVKTHTEIESKHATCLIDQKSHHQTM